MAQLDAFMTLDAKGLGNIKDGPIPGETTDQEMAKKKAIEITGFTVAGDFDDEWLDQNSPSGEKSASKLNDKLKLSVNKNLDSSSPALMIAYCSHLSTVMKEAAPFPKLEIFVRRAGAVDGKGTAQVLYLNFVFYDAYLVSYSCGGEHDSNNDMPTESLVFRFKRVTMNYWPQTATGERSPTLTALDNWDFFQSEPKD